MAFSCISHIFTNLNTSAVRKPTPTHTGLVHRATLPTGPPCAFPPAPNAPTTAFAPLLVSGAEYRARCKELLSRPRLPEKTEATLEHGRGEDGTSWVLANKDVDGWDIGREKATQMFVKRKGRGKFRFEEAMVEGWGVGLRGEVVDEAEKLEDGFGYRGWVDEDMGRDTRVESRDLGEGKLVVGEGILKGRDDAHDEVGVKRRIGVEARRDSIRQPKSLEAHLEQ